MTLLPLPVVVRFSEIDFSFSCDAIRGERGNGVLGFAMGNCRAEGDTGSGRKDTGGSVRGIVAMAKLPGRSFQSQYNFIFGVRVSPHYGTADWKVGSHKKGVIYCGG
jgi:hypothetical protein